MRKDSLGVRLLPDFGGSVSNFPACIQVRVWQRSTLSQAPHSDDSVISTGEDCVVLVSEVERGPDGGSGPEEVRPGLEAVLGESQ